MFINNCLLSYVKIQLQIQEDAYKGFIRHMVIEEKLIIKLKKRQLQLRQFD